MRDRLESVNRLRVRVCFPAWVAMFALLLMWSSALLSAQVAVPPSIDRAVHDYAAVLTSESVNEMERVHSELFRKTEVAIYVVTMPSLDGEPAADFALRLAEVWQPGTRATERGIVVVLAVDDRDISIQTGYGAEGFLPDGRVGVILDGALPQLQRDDWSAGLTQISRALVTIASDEFGATIDGAVAVPTRGRVRENPRSGILGLLGMLLMGYLFFRHPSLFMLMMLSGGGFGGGGFRGGGFGGGGGMGGFGGGGFGGGGASRGF